MYRTFLFSCFFLAMTTPLVAQPLQEIYGGFDGFRSAAPAQRDHLTLEASFAKTPDSADQYWLLLQVGIRDDWHLYSVTQQEGGTLPTRIVLENDKLTITGAVRPTTVPKVERFPYFDVPIESHDKKVDWLIPFRSEQRLDDQARVEGTLTGQVCQDGEGGACIPVSMRFSAEQVTMEKIDPFLTDSGTVPKTFWFYSDEQTADPATVSSLPPIQLTSAASSLAETPRAMTHLERLSSLKPREFEQVRTVGGALLYAFLGGLILNIMPCVLPVIGLKILSFFEQAGKSRFRAFLLNLWYSAGLLSVFLLLAAMSVGLSKLFTFSLFNIVMCTLVFAMALSLMGLWELSAPAFLGRGSSGRLMKQEGAVGAFFKGIITTLLAIPCGAPLLSPAITWADTMIRGNRTGEVFLIYSVIGLGMASPYLIVGAFPELLRFLPKPGAWMETFKKTMGFCLLVAVVWILYFIELRQVVPMVALLFAVWFACWIIGRLEYTADIKQRRRSWFAALFVVFGTLLISFDIPRLPIPYTLEKAMQRRLENQAGLRSEGHWIPYTPGRLEQALLDERRVVLVDFTADWCVNCKVLEATVLESKIILDEIDRRNILSLQADCTRGDGPGSELLRQLGPESVPTMAVFTPDRPTEPIVIRGNYTAETLIKQLP